MTTVNFSFVSSPFSVPVNWLTIVSNANFHKNVLLSIYYSFYGLLNYEGMCREVLLCDISGIKESPLNSNNSVSLGFSLNNLTPSQSKILDEAFDFYRHYSNSLLVRELCFLVGHKFNRYLNFFGKVSVEENGNMLLSSDMYSEFNKPNEIDKVLYFDFKNPSEVKNNLSSKGNYQGEVYKLISILRCSSTELFTQLHSLVLHRQLYDKTLLLLDNVDHGLRSEEVSYIEEVLIKIHRTTGCKIVMTGHETIDLRNGWNVQGYDKHNPYCATLIG